MSERFTINLDELEFNGEAGLLTNVRGRCIVANGCFDIIHPGHLSLLASLDTLAYQMKLRPIVAMNSDASVRRLKGDARPIVPQESRSLLINSLKWPLTVVLFDEDTPQRLMDVLQPAAVLKGSEYPKEAVIRWRDSQVVTVDMVPGWSTSRIVGDTR
jgi:D-beta-D-heptose 7-phosphate kinase/D-beta-D-heptose 1-phosphate adenosyltransferase